MHVVVGGRLTEAIITAVKGFNKVEVTGEETLEDLEKNKENYNLEEVKSITIVDTGLSSYQNWGLFKTVQKYFKQVPIMLYTRQPTMTPKEDYLGENVDLYTKEGSISISMLARKIGNYK